jgi:hypothetical protein
VDPHVPLFGRVYIQQVPAAGKAQVAEQAFDAFTLGGMAPAEFAPVDHHHSVLKSPDGLMEVIAINASGEPSIQVGNAGVDMQSPAAGQFNARALAGTTTLRLLGRDIGPGQSQPTEIFVEAGGNPTATPASGGNIWLWGGESAAGSGGSASLVGGSATGGFGAGGTAQVLGGDSLGGGGGGNPHLRGGSGSTGGDIAIDGGPGAGFPGEGGLVGIRGGEGAVSGQGPGGAVWVVGGRGTPAGEVLVQGGTGYPGNDAEGGDVRIIGGIGGGQIEGDGGPGGDIYIEGGSGEGDLNNPGGDVHIAGGPSSFGTSTGTVFIDSPAQFASTVHVAAEPGATASLTGGSVGGDFAVAASDSSSGNELGSALFLRGGSVLAGGTAGGGGIGLFAGDGAPAGFTNELGGPGGNIVVRGGDGRGVGQNAGGNVVLAGGDSSDGSPARDGIVAIQSLVSILRNAQRPENGAVLQVGQPGFENGNGAFLSNDGVWTNASDVNSKAVVGDVDGREVLARVLALPLKNWRHKALPDGPLHMGPMAQDFFAAFGLGNSERHIGSVDADGVALAAIQGLHAEANQRLVALEEENRQLRERLARLETILQVKE